MPTELTVEQTQLRSAMEEARVEFQKAKATLEVARNRVKMLKAQCKHLYADRDGDAVCAICNHRSSRWYCPDSPRHVCSYRNGDMDECDYCGHPEERL